MPHFLSWYLNANKKAHKTSCIPSLSVPEKFILNKNKNN
jgi:hypothetical protein